MTTHQHLHAVDDVVDPICGMSMSPDNAVGHVAHKGQTYYFCSQSCLERFRATLEAFLGGDMSAAAPPAAAGRVEYTCPMHPEIVRDGPGSCPVCGMALEPRTVTLDEGPNPELVDMFRRFWLSAALTAPLVIGAMVGLLPRWLELALASPVCLWGGWPFFVRGWQSLVNRSLNMFTLIALGVSVAYGYSVVATLFPDRKSVV